MLDILGIKYPKPGRPLDGISLKKLIVDGTMHERPTPIGFWCYDWKPEQKNEPWLADNSLNEMITMTARQEEQLKKNPHAKWYFKNHRHPVANTQYTGRAAWIDGRYKILISRGKTASYELYDLERDIAESRDLASQYPEKVGTMVKQLKAWQKSVENSLTGADYAD